MTQLDAILDTLDTLDLAGLENLRAAVDALIAKRQGVLGEVKGQNGKDTAPNSEGNRPEGRASGRHWVEKKMIRGYGPYAYERWFEGGRKRSRYIGKVVKEQTA